MSSLEGGTESLSERLADSLKVLGIVLTPEEIERALEGPTADRLRALALEAEEERRDAELRERIHDELCTPRRIAAAPTRELVAWRASLARCHADRQARARESARIINTALQSREAGLDTPAERASYMAMLQIFSTVDRVLKEEAAAMQRGCESEPSDLNPVRESSEAAEDD